MSVTFNEFLLKIDEANIAGSRPRGVLTPAERARVSTRRDRSPIKRTGGGVSYISVTPEKETPKETPKEPQKTTSSKEYVQKWIPNFPAPKDLKVKAHKKPKLNRPEKQPKSPKPRVTQLKLKLKEFINLYKKSTLVS